MWGKSELRSDDQPPKALACLADVVRFIGERDDLPSKRAAELVLYKLATGPVHGVFMLRRGDFARTVSDADVWRERYPSGIEFLRSLQREDAEWSRAGMVYLDQYRGNMPTHEAKQRGMAVAPDDEENGVYLSDEKWRSVPELPALRGWSGLVEWLRYCWVQQAAAFSELDAGEHARVALLASDAAALFGFGVEAKPAPAPVVPLRLVHGPEQATAPAQTAIPARKLWTNDEKAEMLADRNEHRMTDTDIGKKWGIKRQRVAQLIGSKTSIRLQKASQQAPARADNVQMQGQMQGRKG